MKAHLEFLRQDGWVKLSPHPILWLPVFIWLRGDEVTVDVSFTRQGSGTPRLLIGTYSRYEEKWNPTEVELIRGTQTVSGRGKGGLLYIRYHTENGEEPGGQVRLEFKSGALKVPHFKLGETDHRDWQHQLEKKIG